jgi:hypothetical protein
MADTFIGEHPPRDGRTWDCQCARCGASMEWRNCDYCDSEGYTGHECGEDCCCCLGPEPNVPCDICDGRGGWYDCCSSAEWCKANPLDGRENIKRHTPEWYTLDPKPVTD